MNICTLTLEQFRNYENERFVLDPAVNLICGENGQGKTNLLEAAAACSTMRLFRTAQKKRRPPVRSGPCLYQGGFYGAGARFRA